MSKLLTLMERIYKKIPQNMIDYLYCTAFLLVLVYLYAYLTRFNREPFRVLYVVGAGLSGIVLIIRSLNTKNEDRKQVCFAIAFLLIGGSYYLVRHSFYYLVLAMLIVGALRVDEKKLLVVFILVTTVFFSIMFVHFLTKTNVVEWTSWTWVHFGSINSTDCQGMIFFILVAWLFYKGEEVRYVELLVMGAFVLWFWRYTKADINMYCSMTCLLLAGLLKSISDLKIETKLKLRQILGYVISLSFLLCAAVMIILAIRYNPNEEKWQKLNLLLHHRLESPHNAFLKYPPCLWGTEYVVVGWGYSPGVNIEEMYAQYGYTFIDSSYPNIIINHGYLVFTMIMGVMTYVSFRYAKRGELFKVLLLAVIAVDCAAESHLKEISCNVWLLLPFAELTQSECQSVSKRKNRQYAPE